MTAKKRGFWVVYLEWQDAVGNASWIGDSDRCSQWAKRSGHMIKESGFLIEEHKDYILFAQRWHPGDAESEEMFGSLHKIPTSWIRNRKKLMFVEDK